MTGANWYMELSPAVSLHCVNVGYLLIMNENNHYMSYFEEYIYLGLTAHACIVSLSFNSFTAHLKMQTFLFVIERY